MSVSNGINDLRSGSVELVWLDALNAKLMQTRDSTRERVTAVADDLAAEIERLTQANQQLLQKLAATELLVAQLRQENASLRR